MGPVFAVMYNAPPRCGGLRPLRRQDLLSRAKFNLVLNLKTGMTVVSPFTPRRNELFHTRSGRKFVRKARTHERSMMDLRELGETTLLVARWGIATHDCRHGTAPDLSIRSRLLSLGREGNQCRYSGTSLYS
jgi:hypothetical protein